MRSKEISEFIKSRDEQNIKKAYVELLSFLNLIDKEKYNKIPKSFIEFMENNKDRSYEKVVYANRPIEEQNLMQETLDLIAFLNLKYWCDEDEKARLNAIYKLETL